MAEISKPKTRDSAEDLIELKRGWDSGPGRSGQKYGPIIEDNLELKPALEEELMGRPGTALLVSARLARLKGARQALGDPEST